MRKICLIWDFDGTLAYREGLWTHSLSCVLERNGYSDFDRQLISRSMQPQYPWAKNEMAHCEYFNGLTWWEYIQKHVVGHALRVIGFKDEKVIDDLAAQFRAEYLDKKSWKLFDDTMDNLERSISNGYNNAILSNHTPELEKIAGWLKIDKYFSHIITSADTGYEKPNSKMFDMIKIFGEFDQYYMIGDNYEADILGAQEYGINAIMVRKPNDNGYMCYSEDLSGIWEFIK